MHPTDPSQDYLTDFQSTLIRATGGQRFANHVIDMISIFSGVFVIAYIIASVSPEFFANDQSELGLQLIVLIIYVLFYFIIESLFRGKTLGKLITGTRAVNIDGSYITPKQAFNRSISRIVPFEAFSAFGTPCDPWHDRWSDTMVIDEKKSQRIYQ